MADLKSTIVNGNLRVTSDANVSGNLEGATISENGTQLSDKYLQLSGGTMTGGNISWTTDNHGVYLYGGCGIEKCTGFGPALVSEGAQTDFWIRKGDDRSVNYKIIHEGNIGSKTDTIVTKDSSKLITSGAVFNAIDNLPEPMVFKGTLGTGGTITALPTAAASNEGFTYKVITAGTYASQSAKVGDVFVSNGSAWVIIPAGDTDTDTWRNIKVNGTQLLGSALSTGAVNFKSGSNVTITGSGNDITIASSYTDTNTWRSIQVNDTQILGTGIGTGALNLKAGNNVTLANSSGNVTIDANVPEISVVNQKLIIG